MAPAVVLGPLDRMPECVTIVQDDPDALLGEVFAHDPGLDPDRAFDQFPFPVICRQRRDDRIALDEFENRRVGDEAGLDDFGQAGTLVRKIMDNAARDRLVSNVVGHLKNGVKEPVLSRAFEYWRNIDRAVGDRIAKGVRGERAAAAE